MKINGVKEHSTGRWVSFEGLSDAERAVAFFIATVDPNSYDGGSGRSCLMGQGGRYLRNHAEELGLQDYVTERSDVTIVSDALGLDYQEAYRIYGGVESGRVATDFNLALHLTAEILDRNIYYGLDYHAISDDYYLDDEDEDEEDDWDGLEDEDES